MSTSVGIAAAQSLVGTLYKGISIGSKAGNGPAGCNENNILSRPLKENNVSTKQTQYGRARSPDGIVISVSKLLNLSCLEAIKAWTAMRPK
jgi:hypothetical protein